jgi:cyclopropane-fatty-acyl-phospholipid synthase
MTDRNAFAIEPPDLIARITRAAVASAIALTEQGVVPDALLRAGVRRLCAQRLAEIHADDAQAAAGACESLIAHMDTAPIALVPEKANTQHYEVPAALYALTLGKHRKYSCCWWPRGTETLDRAEEVALAATCARAKIGEHQSILELGCGWGSLTLWMARRYPKSRITAVSNSASQREHILSEAARLGIENVSVITADANTFDTTDTFDRVVSVEMFEHMRNWRALLQRVHRWLAPGGLFFMHVFCHRSTPYLFLDGGSSDWMSRHFFSGGMMPSDDLAVRLQDDLRLLARWRWDGTHYERTANAWLANLDANRDAARAVLAATYGNDDATQWLNRWRLFFIACAETFGYRGGQEWWVSHYLFESRSNRAPASALHA